MYFVTKKKGLVRLGAVVLTAMVGLAACGGSSSEQSQSTDSPAQSRTKNAALTTLPTMTTVSPTVKTCDPASPCKLGDTMTDGGTVFFYSPIGFNCDATLASTSRQCNMLAVADSGWYVKAKTLYGAPGPCGDPTGGKPDPTCLWNTGNSTDVLNVTTKGEVGAAQYNVTNLANAFKPTGRIPAASLAKAFTGMDNKTAGYGLPTLQELNLLCNWVNYSAPSASTCRPTKRLRPGFASAPYWSSTIDPMSMGLKAHAVHFGIGMSVSSNRANGFYVRPVRAFRGYPDPSLIPATTTTTATVPRTTVVPTTLPPTTLPPTTLPPTTVPTCATGGVCQVDDIGPGGGTVFYAGAPFACGPNLDKTCKYMEAAPESWSAPAGAGCSGSGISMSCPWPTNASNGRPATAKTLGAGAKNTAAMYAFSATGAAATVRAYNGGGKTDWFIPSYDEANEFCKWAHFGSSGQEISDPTSLCKISFHMRTFYNRPPLMTSTDSSAENVFSYLINATSSTGPLIKDAPKTDGYMVWPVRAF